MLCALCRKFFAGTVEGWELEYPGVFTAMGICPHCATPSYETGKVRVEPSLYAASVSEISFVRYHEKLASLREAIRNGKENGLPVPELRAHTLEKIAN